ncbi:MAG TPA: zinc ribbon domain-containing protein [Gammaproteobacteria bacterium]
MPIYEYRCRACAHAFEELVRLGETPRCPACGAADPERLFSTSASVSTTKTQTRAKLQARRAARAIKREKDHAQREYERNYLKEHS